MRRIFRLPSSRVGKWSALVATNLAVAVALVALLEIVTSIYVTWPLGNRVAHPLLHHTWKPNASFIHREWIEANPDFPEPYVHRFNAQGWLEEYDVEREKPPGVYRIFYLGDSFTEGMAPMDRSMPSLVESEVKRLGELVGLGFEVINAGTSSHSPIIHYVNLRYVLLEYDPDLVVVNVDMTDAHDDGLYARKALLDENGDPLAIRPDVAFRIELFLYNHSYTYHYIRKIGRWLHDLRTSRRGGEPVDASRWPPGWFDWAVEREWSEQTARNARRTLGILSDIVELARESGVKIMLTAVPHHEQYAGNPDGSGEPLWTDRPHYLIGEHARELSVPYLNTYEALRPLVAGTPWTRYYYAGDMHFNPRGYRIWADAQLQFLLDPANGLLPDVMYAEAVEPDS